MKYIIVATIHSDVIRPEYMAVASAARFIAADRVEFVTTRPSALMQLFTGDDSIVAWDDPKEVLDPNSYIEISAPLDNGFRIETATMIAVVPQVGSATAYRAALRADGADVQLLVYSDRGCFYEVSRGFDQTIIQFMMLADGFIASK